MTTATVTLRPLDQGGDLGLVHGWMQQPHVTPWWELQGPVERTAGYLAAATAQPHQRSWIASIDGSPFAYVETYVVARDALAGYYPAGHGDRGFHLLVGPPVHLGTGASRLLARRVVGDLLARPGVDRVVCEPDVRNERMLAYCSAVGGERIATLELPGKTAALFAWTAAP